jgi:hypothetical protein
MSTRVSFPRAPKMALQSYFYVHTADRFGDHQVLDLGRTLKNVTHLCVAMPALDRELACLSRDGQKTALQSYFMCIPEIAREMTSCWISAVPSKMS